MSRFRILDLFSGIGGFSLGLERAGDMKTAAFCEIDPACRRVLEKHWKGVPCFENVETLAADQVGDVNLICGGFPCQDASIGQTQWGKRIGIAGERTGLWKHIKRLADEIRPEIILLENVPGLFSAGFGSVLGDLAEIGFDAEWRCFSASAAGLPHKRERVFVVAYPCGSRFSRYIEGESILESAEKTLAFARDDIAGTWRSLERDLDSLRGRDEISVAMDRRRVKALGNAVVPHIPEAIGRAILETDKLAAKAA